MDRLTEIQLKLRDFVCPRCYHSEFEVTVQPGEEGEPAHHIARCRNCGYRFEVENHTPAWEHLEDKTFSRLRREGCPRCQSHRLELNFRCALENHECFHIATCQNCGAAFVVEKPDAGRRPAILDR
jgi:transcription elongation factor Elf1